MDFLYTLFISVKPSKSFIIYISTTGLNNFLFQMRIIFKYNNDRTIANSEIGTADKLLLYE